MHYLLRRLYFALHYKTKHVLVGREEFCYHSCGSMRTVSRAEGISYVYITQSGELLCKTTVPLFFFLVVTQVFQQEHFTGFKVLRHPGSVFAPCVGAELYFAVKECSKMVRYGLQGKMRERQFRL